MSTGPWPSTTHAAYTPELATSLNNLANSQAENGQQHEALKTAQEAVTIRKKLAEQNPAAYNPDLATSLNNLAILLSGGELYKQALNYAQEATTLFRGLAGEQLRAFGSRFVATLRTYAIILDHCGDAAEAARIRQERNETLKRMKEMETGND
nr:tetratricopeptide repeat protein [Actinomyces sp. oral taxon 849]